MPTRTNTLAEARRFLDWLRGEIGRELRLARLNAGRTQREVAVRLGWSKSKVSRIERGRSRRVTAEDIVLLAAAVGLRPSVKFFPFGQPVRDIGQVELLAALNRRMHPSWRTSQEVPVPRRGDLRAADQLSSIPGCSVMVEAYRRLADWQAQNRQAREKQRDLGADRLLILLEDTHANRRALASIGEEARRSFPVPPRRMVSALARGVDPGGDGIVLLRRARAVRPGLRVAPHATNGEQTAAHSRLVASGAAFRE